MVGKAGQNRSFSVLPPQWGGGWGREFLPALCKVRYSEGAAVLLCCAWPEGPRASVVTIEGTDVSRTHGHEGPRVRCVPHTWPLACLYVGPKGPLARGHKYPRVLACPRV